MSERRSLPPMQYAPPEDGHANHDAIRPDRAARFQHFSTVECAAAGFPKLARLLKILARCCGYVAVTVRWRTLCSAW